VIGAALISYSEHNKKSITKGPAPPPPSLSVSSS